MTDQWLKTTTIHGASVGPTMVNGDQFVCGMKLECTSTEVPMAGQRMNVSEQCLYTVREGKIAEAMLFFDSSNRG
jgi:predicted ester cyclase